MKEKGFLSLFLTIVCAIFGIVDASAAVMAASAASVGAAAINADGSARATVGADGAAIHTTTNVAQGGLNTDTIRLGSDLIDDPIDQLVVKMFQSAVAVDQICRHLTQVKQNGMRFSFWSVDTRPVADTVSTAFAAVSTGYTGTLVVSNPNMFDKTDVLVVPTVLGYDFNSGTRSTKSVPLNLYIKEITDSGLVVQAVNGDYSTTAIGIPAIPAGTRIFRLGHAASEGDVQTTPYAAIPEPDELFMQIFKTQVMESTISIDSDKKVSWSLADQQELALYNMRKEIELSYIYGVKGYFREQTSKRYVYTCSGVLQQILEKGNVISYTAGSLTEASLMSSIVKPIFLGNSGSSTRYMFAGSDLVAEIAVLPGVQRQMGATQVLRKFGMDWKTLQFMSWQINLYQHPLMDEIGLSRCAIVLDLPHVRKNVFRSLTTDVLELIKTGVYDGKSTVWTEISALGLKYPKCHAFIREVSQFAPTESGAAAADETKVADAKAALKAVVTYAWTTNAATTLTAVNTAIAGLTLPAGVTITAKVVGVTVVSTIKSGLTVDTNTLST